jgi:cytochrome P450
MSETGATPIINLFDPEVRADPYPHYRILLQAPPVKFTSLIAAVIVSRYDEVERVLADYETFSNQRPEQTPFRQLDLTAGSATMLGSDPPVQARLRKLVSRDFTPRRIAAMAPRIREITRALLDQVEASGRFDAVADLANQLPVLVIAEMLGIPTQRHREFKAWSNAIVASSAVPPHMPRPPEAIEAVAAMREFLAGEIQRRRSSPGPDLISALIVHHAADVLNSGELLACLILLLMAGNETTTNLIGNGLLALMRNPEQLALVRNRPALMDSAVEEILRFDSPVQGAIRVARKQTNIGGVEVDPGILVIVLLGAANRDSSKFDRPDTFDITRNPNDHLAFGRGIHFCLGAQLARLEGSIALTSVLERFPRLALADPGEPLSYRGSLFLRGLTALPLTI